MNHFRCSDGTRVTKAQIDRNVTKAKKLKIEEQLEAHGYNFCEEPGCGKNQNCGEPLDCSHDISVNECQNSGRAELAWDYKNNITIRCRTCHNAHDAQGAKERNI